jgi:hypothetical protein
MISYRPVSEIPVHIAQNLRLKSNGLCRKHAIPFSIVVANVMLNGQAQHRIITITSRRPNGKLGQDRLGAEGMVRVNLIDYTI